MPAARFVAAEKGPATHGRRARRRWPSRVAAAAVVLFVGAAIALPIATSPAASSGGWNIVNSPPTADAGYDLPLAITCANAQQCWSVGQDLVVINGGGVMVHPFVEEWDGTGWSVVSTPQLPPPGGGFLGATCVTGSDCWAVGALLSQSDAALGALAEHWDGSTWSVVATPNPAGAAGAVLRSVSCVSTTDCWAVGNTTANTGVALANLVEHWDGTSWSVVAPADTGQSYSQLNAVTCVSVSDCWAGGTAGATALNPSVLPIFPDAVGDQSLIEHWGGNSWTVVPSYVATAPTGGYVGGLTCLTADNCWATGSTTDGLTGFPSGGLVQRWNGSSWTVVPSPAMPEGGGILSAVACLGANECWASGATGNPEPGMGNGFQPTPVIEAWNGTTWSIEPSPNVVAYGLLASVDCVRADACWADGAAVTNIASTARFVPLIEQMVLPPQGNQGFLAVSSDGGAFNFGVFPFRGSMGGVPLNRPVVGVAATPDGGGYWEVASDGGIFSFGDAGYDGSMGGHPLNEPVVGLATTPDGGGYWEVASDGGIFNFGDAGFYGSMGGVPLDRPIVGMAAAPDGKGYWEVASDGGIFAFGSAKFYGSMGGVPLSRPVVGMAATPNGKGYWEVASDGGIFNFGNAPFLGSVPGQGIRATVPIIGMADTPDGLGYWEVGADGSTYGYGDAVFLGSLVGTPLAAPVVGAAS